MKSSKPCKSSTLAPPEAGIPGTQGVTPLREGEAGGRGPGAGIPTHDEQIEMEVDGKPFVLVTAAHPEFAYLLQPNENPRTLLKRKRDNGELILPPSAAAWGYLPKGKRGKWTQSTAKHSTAKLFVAREWVDSLGSGHRNDENAGEPQETAPPSDHCVLQDKRDNQVNANDGPEADDGRPDSPLAEADLADAPALVTLADAQKFRDSAGNILEIEMRGERTVDELFFYARDVATKMLQQDPKRLAKNRSDAQEDREEEEFKCFRRNGRRALFLTYLGLIRALFASRSPFASNFCQQAVRILFTVHHGSACEQKQLATKLLGLENVRSFLKNLYPSKLCVVYLIKLGTVGPLRHSLGITNPNLSDDVIVVKVGFSEDGRERLRVHNLDFAPIAGAQVLFHKAIILDEAQLSNCETDVKRFFALQLSWPLVLSGIETLESGNVRRPKERRTEIFGIPPGDMKTVEKEFENLQCIHGARYSLLAAQLDGMKATLETAKELHAVQMRAKGIENDMLRQELSHERERHQLDIGRHKLEIQNVHLQQENIYLKKAAEMQEAMMEMRVALASKQ